MLLNPIAFIRSRVFSCKISVFLSAAALPLFFSFSEILAGGAKHGQLLNFFQKFSLTVWHFPRAVC
jgi:hypothetical protein